jgi:mannose-6-phosphate isomerase-like protein (cupin superfamily)
MMKTSKLVGSATHPAAGFARLITDNKKAGFIVHSACILLTREMSKQESQMKNSLKGISDRVAVSYDNFVIENVNDHCIRMAVMQGEYRWHYHNNTDELFIVLEGELKIEIKDSDTIFLKPGEFIKIPAKTVHKTSAADRTVNLTFEKNAQDTIFVD